MFGFCEGEVQRLHDALVSPRSEAKDTEGECVKLADDDNDILSLNVDWMALEEKRWSGGAEKSSRAKRKQD